MGLFSYLRGDALTSEKALTGSAGFLETLAARQTNLYSSLGGTNLARQRVNASYVCVQNASYGWIYLYTPAVRAVVDYVARNAAQLGLKLYQRVSDTERKEVGDHPAAYSLRNPNPQTTGPYFIQGMFKDLLVYNNAYAYKIPNDQNGEITFVRLTPYRVGLVGPSYFEIEQFRLWRVDGSYEDVDPERVMHWRGTDGDDPRRGESYLETLREEIATDTAARKSVSEIFANGLAQSGWLERPLEAPELSPDAFQRLSEQTAAQMKAGNRRSPIFEEGMTFKTSGVTPEDAEYLKAREYTREAIASLYGMKNVPPETAEEQQQFLSDVLPPLLDMVASFLNLQVLKQDYGLEDHYFEFDLSEKLMGPELYKALTAASGRPVLLTDEARAMIDKPPVDGGDELLTPVNMTEAGQNPPAPKPSTGVMPIQDPNKPPQDGSYRTDQPQTPIPASRRSMNGHDKRLLIPRRRHAHDRRNRWAGIYQQEVLDPFFARQERVTKSKQLKAVTDERWDRELSADLLLVYLRQFAAEGQHPAFRLKTRFDSKLGTNWLKAKADGTASDMNRITQEAIDQLGREAAFQQAKAVRAPAAAMAMATDVMGFATKAVTQQASGDPWVTIDGGDCEICAPYQGTWRASELDAWPAYHPSCNCVADVEADPNAKALQTEVEIIEAQGEQMTKALNILKQIEDSHTEAYKALSTAIGQQKAPQVNVSPAVTNFHEGAFNSTTNVEAAKPAEAAQINFPKGMVEVRTPISVEPAQTHIHEGAIKSAPVNVEAPNVTIAEGAVRVPMNVEAPQVNVQAPPPQPAPNVDVTVKAGKKTVTFSDGRKAEIEEE